MSDGQDGLNILRKHIDAVLERWSTHTKTCKVCDVFENRQQGTETECCEDGRNILLELQRLI